MSDIAISVRNVSKCYRVFENQRARLRFALMPASRIGVREVWALQGVDFEVKRGESVAIIGRNGSGKSTLLEIVSRTLTPTTGSVQVTGRVAALLELGSGFNPEFTGRENVFLNGFLLGLSRAEVLRRFDAIISFADIGDVLDRPVKTYSSGMLVRLAFAVQVALEPDILIVDEALSVGDFFFQQKCLHRIRELQERGTTILFVSHDMQTVRDLCQKGLLLEQGIPKFFGNNLTAVNHYLSLAVEKSTASAHAIVAAQARVPSDDDSACLPSPLWRNGDCTPRSIIEVGAYNVQGEAVTAITLGETLLFKVRFYDNESTPAHVMLTLHNRYNQIVTVQGTFTHPLVRPRARENGMFEIQFQVVCNLEAGEYSCTFSLAESQQVNAGTVIHETPRLGPLALKWDYQSDIPPFFGLCGIPVFIQYTDL